MHRTYGLLLATGLFLLWPATSAQAQFSYGYDSLTYSSQPSNTYYYSSGYSAIYTDPSVGVYNSNSLPAPPRTVAPYYGSPNAQPTPYAAVTPYSNSSAIANRSAASQATARRGLLRRFRSRR